MAILPSLLYLIGEPPCMVKNRMLIKILNNMMVLDMFKMFIVMAMGVL